MGRYLYFILALLTATSALAQSCTPANAHPIDADVAFLAYWEIIVVSWVAIAAVFKRDPVSLDKRVPDLVCTASEECLSFKSVAFCHDRKAHTFHAADGTTGNFLTGVYTLADGRVGNMYYGPYPTNSKGVAAVTTTGSGGGVPTTVIASQVTVTVVSTPGGSLATSPAITSQQGVVSSKVATPAGSAATGTQTPSSSTILKSEGSRMTSSSWSTLSRMVVILLGLLNCV